MMNTAARCPACGSSNLHVAEWYNEDGDSTYYMVCDDCGYEDPDKFEEEYVAVDHWNRRVVKGYIDGEDPTDTEYDQLDELDWAVIPEYDKSDNGHISWTGSDSKFGSSRRAYKDYPNRRAKNDDDE